MKIIEPGYEILTPISAGGIEELKKIELAARTCYKSEGRIREDGSSAKRLVADLIKRGHEAMLEHGGMTVRFICDRGVSHELVRHRLCSFAQESTRYCNYGLNSFGQEITVIKPVWADEAKDPDAYELWKGTMLCCEDAYMELLSNGYSAQQARCVLPNALKTEVVMTANWREWRKIFGLRCALDAHPDMRRLMVPLWREMCHRIPGLFDDCYQDSEGSCDE